MGYAPKSDKTYTFRNIKTGEITTVTKKNISSTEDLAYRKSYKESHPDKILSSVSTKQHKP